MRAGTLRQRVQLQEKQVVRDTFGAEVVTWATLATVWGAVEPLQGREFLDAQQIQAEISTRIRMRYRGDITVSPEKRVVWGAHVYDVLAVIEPETRRRELVLMCKEAVE